MTVDITLAFTACSRPRYLARTLTSWEAARGTGDMPVMFRCEPGFPQVHQMCRDAFGGAADVTVNQRRLGEAANQWYAIDDAFTAGADFVILAEDDDVVATDTIEYFTWAASHFRDREGVLAVCTFRHHRHPGGYAGVALDPSFKCNVWGIWRDRWEDMVAGDWNPHYMADGWDTRMTRWWVQQQGWRTVLPCESRCQNIGEFGGAHGDGPRALSDCWQPVIGPQDYTEVP